MSAAVEMPTPLSQRVRLFATMPAYSFTASQAEFLYLARLCERDECGESDLIARAANLQAKLDNALLAQSRWGRLNVCFLLSICAHEYLAGPAAAIAGLLQ